jgi:hypothetical protein
VVVAQVAQIVTGGVTDTLPTVATGEAGLVGVALPRQVLGLIDVAVMAEHKQPAGGRLMHQYRQDLDGAPPDVLGLVIGFKVEEEAAAITAAEPASKRVAVAVAAPVILVVLPVAKLLPEITRVTALRK